MSTEVELEKRLERLEKAVQELQSWIHWHGAGISALQTLVIQHPIQPPAEKEKLPQFKDITGLFVEKTAEPDDKLDEYETGFSAAGTFHRHVEPEDKCKSCKFYATPADCNCENYSAYEPKACQNKEDKK